MDKDCLLAVTVPVMSWPQCAHPWHLCVLLTLCCIPNAILSFVLWCFSTRCNPSGSPCSCLLASFKAVKEGHDLVLALDMNMCILLPVLFCLKIHTKCKMHQALRHLQTHFSPRQLPFPENLYMNFSWWPVFYNRPLPCSLITVRVEHQVLKRSWQYNTGHWEILSSYNQLADLELSSHFILCLNVLPVSKVKLFK